MKKRKISLILLSVLFLVLSTTVFGLDRKVTIVHPKVNGLDINNQTYKIYDISELAANVKTEKAGKPKDEIQKEILERAVKLSNEQKNLVYSLKTKAIPGIDGACEVVLPDSKVYFIETENNTTKPMVLDLFEVQQENIKIFSKENSHENKDKKPLKKTGLNKNIFVEIFDFIKLFLVK